MVYRTYIHTLYVRPTQSAFFTAPSRLLKRQNNFCATNCCVSLHRHVVVPRPHHPTLRNPSPTSYPVHGGRRRLHHRHHRLVAGEGHGDDDDDDDDEGGEEEGSSRGAPGASPPPRRLLPPHPPRRAPLPPRPALPRPLGLLPLPLPRPVLAPPHPPLRPPRRSLPLPPRPLRRLRLCSDYSARHLLDLLDPISWLLRSRPLGLRHLHLDLHHETLIFLLPFILDFETLESLYLSTFSNPYGDKGVVLPDTIRLARLRSLSLYLLLEPLSLTRLIASAPVLEDLNLRDVSAKQVDLSAPNLKRLDFNSHWLLEVRLCCPKLELLRLRLSGRLAKYEGFMPLLRRAHVTLLDLTAEDAAAVGCVIQSVANVSELKMKLSAGSRQFLPVRLLVDEERSPPTFPNLRCLFVYTSFHELNIRDMITLLDHTPVLDSLELCHSSPYISDKTKKAKDWQSKLPRNSDGNYQTACFSDLRAKKRRTEAVKLLSKRLKIKP